MAKYRVDQTQDAGRAMFAEIALTAGEMILSEAPLEVLPIGLKDTYNAPGFFGKGSHNGGDHLERLYTKMTAAKQAQIDALHNVAGPFEDEKARFKSLVALNAFDDEDKDEKGQPRTTLYVYNAISRINHSCRPNAMVDYNKNEGGGMGTLYALTNIPQDGEITINYMSTEKEAFQTRYYRQTQLRKHYNFECNCAACQTGNNENRDRSAAKKESVEVYEWDTMDQETVAEARARRINSLIVDYIPRLLRLHVSDLKMVKAWKRLGKLHQEDFVAALGNPQHCAGCRNHPQGRHFHLYEAISATRQAKNYCMRCSGPKHPFKLKLDRKMRELDDLTGFP